MRSVSYQPAPDPRRAFLRRRGTAFLLALAVHVLLVFMLLRLTTSPPSVPEQASRAITFEMLPGSRTASRSARTAKVKRASSRASARSAATPAASPHAPPLSSLLLPGLEHFNLTEMAASPAQQGNRESSDRGSGGADGGSSSGDEMGPGGERLYNAEWYREPTHAELAPYLPAGMAQAGWGMIACQTVVNYRVENCRELDQSPIGSGLARAVRQAAWQFRVLPPRIDGRPVIGAWVRIRIDYAQAMAR